MTPQKVDILGTRINSVSVQELRKSIVAFAASGGSKTVLYANANSINLSLRDPEFKRALDSADILHGDGWGVVLASRLLGDPLKEKIVVTDFFADFCEECARHKISMYFLGGRPGFTEKAKEVLREKNSTLNVVGEHFGYFSEEDDHTVIEDINRCHPDILVVGMGTPKQEKWIHNNRQRLKVAVCWSVGGLFDFLSGKTRRAPQWMLRYHLEWLYRLSQDPMRLWRRYLLGNALFIYRVLNSKLFFKG